jgi:imidazolonepropionase-like amidohydrolase
MTREIACGPVIFRARALLADPYSAALSDVAMETLGGKITRIYAAGSLSAGAAVHDLGDTVVVAGVIDAHVHLGFDGTTHPEAIMCNGDRQALGQLVSANAEALLRSGVTTVRDLGCLGVIVTELAARWGSDPRYPTVVAANEPLTTAGGHCSYMATKCDDLDALLEAVRRRRAEGASIIKIMLTGGFMHAEGDTPYRSVYELGTLERVVRAAHEQGIAVAVHAHGTKGIMTAAQAGADTIEHCSMAAPGGVDIDSTVLAVLAERRVVAVPTVSSVWDRPLPWASRNDAIEVITRLNQAEVPIALGTDTGIPGVLPGDHVAGLRVLREAGLGPEQVWAAATVIAAAACRLNDRVGQLKPGYQADFLVLDADPREDLSTLERLLGVYRGAQPAGTGRELA